GYRCGRYPGLHARRRGDRRARQRAGPLAHDRPAQGLVAVAPHPEPLAHAVRPLGCSLRRPGDLHLVVEVVGDEMAHDLVEILVELEAELARARRVDALGPAVTDLLDCGIVPPDHLADL